MRHSKGKRALSIFHIERLCLALACLAALAGCAGAQQQTHRWTTTDLGFSADTRILNEGELDPGDASHPLNTTESGGIHSRLPSDDQQVVTAYGSGYGFSAVITQPTTLVVAMYSYDYATPDAAEQAMALLQAHMLALTGVGPLGAMGEPDGLHGEQLVVLGSEGDAVAWFVGMQDNTLVLLMVNGMDWMIVSDQLGLLVERVIGGANLPEGG